MVGQFREKLRKARGRLHDYMSRPALYFRLPYVPGDTPVLPISVRVWDHWLSQGDMKGTTFNYAEREDDSPQIIFMRSEVEPVHNFIVSVEPGVAYRIAAPLAPNDISITARVSRLHPDEAQGLPIPGDLIPTNVRIAAIFPSFSAGGTVE